MCCRKMLLLFTVVSFAVFGSTSGFAAEYKIGVMNVQKIVVTCDAGKAAKERFETKMNDLKTGFREEEEGLKKLQAEIKKKSSAWSEEKKAEKIREFKKSGREFQTKTEDARFEMKQLQDKELEPILKALEKVVNKYGKDNGYTLILDSKNGVIFFDDKVEISDLVIKKLNETMAAK